MAETKSLASQIPTLMRRSARRRGFTEAHVLMAWAHICPEYHAFSRPAKLWEDTLTVEVNSDSARQNMQLWAPTLRARLNQFYGYEAIAHIRFVTKVFERKQDTPPPLQNIGEKALAKAEKLCDYVADEELRASLVRLGGRIMEDKKQ